MKDSNCKDCTKRHLGCHISCKTYIHWKSEHNKLIAAIRQDAIETYEVSRKMLSTYLKTRRRK